MCLPGVQPVGDEDDSALHVLDSIQQRHNGLDTSTRESVKLGDVQRLDLSSQEKFERGLKARSLGVLFLARDGEIREFGNDLGTFAAGVVSADASLVLWGERVIPIRSSR
jgi:hypothetical protein